MSRMPPSFSGGLLCASAAVADIASTAATMPVIALFMKASLFGCRIACGFEFCRRDHAAWINSGKALTFSAKRNDATIALRRME